MGSLQLDGDPLCTTSASPTFATDLTRHDDRFCELLGSVKSRQERNALFSTIPEELLDKIDRDPAFDVATLRAHLKTLAIKTRPSGTLEQDLSAFDEFGHLDKLHRMHTFAAALKQQFGAEVHVFDDWIRKGPPSEMYA